MARSQLNINISPDLLKKIKVHATKQGLTITEYVTKTLSSMLDEESELSLQQRIESLEEKIKILMKENRERTIK